MRGSTRRPALERLLQRMDSPAFALPAPLCGPVYGKSCDNARSQKTFLALCWMSASMLRDGVQARFQAPLWEVTAATGLERMSGNGPVRDAVPILSEEIWLSKGEAAARPLFESIGIVETNSGPVVEWVFDPVLAQMFAAPPQYALLDIREIASLTTSVEVMLYILVRQVWKRRHRRILLDEQGMRDICAAPDRPYKRLVERIRRTTDRLSRLLGEDIGVAPLPGSRAGSGIVIELGGRRGSIT